MPAHHFERASPPDDGHLGSYTIPEQLLFTAPEDTRSSETIGAEPFQPMETNSGLLQFWTAVILLELLILAAL